MRTANSFLLLICSLFISFSIFAAGGSGGLVPPPPGMPPCAANPLPGNTACDATPICNVHGFCGTTSSSYTVDTWPQLTNSFCSGIQNNSFLTFTAEATSITFNTYVYNCNSNEAIQIFIFDAASCNSGPVTSYTCLQQMYASSTPYTVSANGLVPGNQYYIMIDGFSGQVCDYTFVAVDGVALPLGLDIGNNVTICQDESVTATAFGGDGTYTWDASPDLSATTGATVIITPPSAIGSYTYTVHSQGGVPNCPTANDYTLTVNVQACCAIIDNNVSLLSCDAANGVYSVTGELTITGPQTTGDLIVTDCNGNTQNLPLGSTPYTYTINGLSLGSPSCNIETYFSGTSECSHVLTHVLTYNAPTTTTPSFDAITLCEGEQAPSLSNASLEGITGTWSPASINTSTTGVTNYTFTPDAGYCSPAVVLGVNVNALPDVNVTTPVTLDCSTSPEVPIEATSSTPGVTYLWSDIYGGATGIVSGVATPTATVSSVGEYIITVTNPATGCTSADTVTVVGNGDEPQVSIDPSIDLDCNTTTTTLVGHPLNSSGTQDNLTYEWSTPDGNITSGVNGTTADIDGVGTYVLTVTDQINGCTTSALVLVDGNLDVPVITLETPILQITCEYPVIPLGGTSDIGEIGTWAASVNGNIVQVGDTLGMNFIAVDAPGTYTYTVTNPLSLCSSSMDVVITENTSPPSVSAGPDLALCPGGTAILQGQGSSTTGATVTYSWDGTDGAIWLYDFADIPNPEVPANVTYILTVTDESNGCTASDTVVVIEHVNPVIFNDTTLCGASFQVPGGSVSVVGIFTWSEQNGNGSFDDTTSLTPVFTAAPGNYVLTLTDACTSVSANVTIHSVPAVSSPSDNCEVPKELIVNSPFGGTWSGTGLAFAPSATVSGGATVTTTATANPGTYTATFTANSNGISSCAFNESFTLIFPVEVSVFADTTVCAPSFQVPVGSITSSGSGQWIVSPAGSGTFTPSTTELHPVFTPNPGVTSVTLIYEDVCDSDSAAVIFPPRPVVSTPPAYSCNDLQETIYTTSYSGGVWSVIDNPSTTWHEDTAIVLMPGSIISAGAVNTPTYVSSHPTAGTYTLTFTENTCNYTETITLNFLPYPWTEINDTTLCLGVSYQLSAWEGPNNSNYTWNTGATGPSVTVTQSGVYYVVASNDCYSMTDSAAIVFEACDITAPNVISISSQAGNNIWYVNSAGVSDFNCIIVNRWGNLIYEYNDVNGYWDGRDRSGNIVSEGVYFYKINATLEGGEKIDKHGFIQVVH